MTLTPVQLAQISRNNAEHVAIQRDYAFYTEKLAAQQQERDAFDEAFGLPTTNLAWQATMQRAKKRAASRTSWNEQLASFRQEQVVKRYAAAVA